LRIQTIRLPFGEGRLRRSQRKARGPRGARCSPIRSRIGKIYHLTGPQSENMRFLHKEYSEALGRTITYQDIPVDRGGTRERGFPLRRETPRGDGHSRAGRFDDCRTTCSR
jgi:hypothetical protein